MTQVEFADREYEFWLKSERSKFLDVYCYNLDKNKLETNSNDEHDVNSNVFYIVGDKRNIFLLLEIRNGITYCYREFDFKLNLLFGSNKFNTLISVLKESTGGKVEKR